MSINRINLKSKLLNSRNNKNEVTYYTNRLTFIFNLNLKNIYKYVKKKPSTFAILLIEKPDN